MQKTPDEEVPLKTIIISGQTPNISPSKNGSYISPNKNNTASSPIGILTSNKERSPLRLSPTTISNQSSFTNNPPSASTNVEEKEEVISVEIKLPELPIADTSTNVAEKPSLPKEIEQKVEETTTETLIEPTIIVANEKPQETFKSINDTKVTTSNGSAVKNQNTSSQSATSRPCLKRTKKGGIIESKPPNVLVYSESTTNRENVISTLKNVLEVDMYTVYPLIAQDIRSRVWMDNTTLLIVCGNVPKDIGKILLDYFIQGGKMLCLCSDVLHIVLPTYRMAEVKETQSFLLKYFYRYFS